MARDEPAVLAEAADAAASDARLLLEAGRSRGAALLHAEACALLLRALLVAGGAAPEGGLASLPRDDTLVRRLRAVWLDRPAPGASAPREADLRAMADGLRALVTAVQARVAPPEPARRATIPAGPTADERPATPRTGAQPSAAKPPAPSRRTALSHGQRPPRSQPVIAPSAPNSSTASTRDEQPPPVEPSVPRRRTASAREEPSRLQPAAEPPPSRRQEAPAREERPSRALPTPATPPSPRRPVSSAAFWSLIDRWGVDDSNALALIGHAGGLTKRGTRPRFRLAGAELDRYRLLQSLDDALAALGTAPRDWLGRDPAGLDGLVRGGEAAILEATRSVVAEGLRRSLAPPPPPVSRRGR